MKQTWSFQGLTFDPTERKIIVPEEMPAEVFYETVREAFMYVPLLSLEMPIQVVRTHDAYTKHVTTYYVVHWEVEGRVIATIKEHESHLFIPNAVP